MQTSLNYIRYLKILTLLGCWNYNLLCSAQTAEDESYFDFSEQSLTTALQQFISETNLQLFYRYDQVANRRVGPLQGHYSVDEALTLLLKDSDLIYAFADENTIVLKKIPRQAVQATVTPIEEITITARRKDEDLQTIPLSITAFQKGSLDNSPYRQLSNQTNLAANINTSLGQDGGSSALQIFIRGIGEIDYMLTTDPAVGLYIDGVYIARTSSANFDLSNMEQIEILRGPQGTLFGKNSIGGALNITTVNPSEHPGYEVSTRYNNDDSSSFRFYGESGILANVLSLNGSVEVQSYAGWQRRERYGNGGEQNRTLLTSALRWTPSELLQSTLKIDAIDQDQASYANVIVETNPSALVMSSYNLSGTLIPCCIKNSISYSGSTNPISQDDVSGLGLSWTNIININSLLNIKTITGYRKNSAKFGQDYDHSVAEYYAFGDMVNHEQFSQEFQFMGVNRSLSLDWILGIYFFQESGTDQSKFVLAPAAVANGDLTIDLNIASKNKQEVKSNAIYFNANKALSEQLTLAVGLRFTAEEKIYTKDSIRTVTQQPYFPGYTQTASTACSDTGAPELGSPFTCKDHWEKASPKLSITHQYSDQIMFYSSLSRGFRSGGFNGRPITLSLISSYEPESLNAYEVGMKSYLFSNRLRFNTSFYLNKYKNKQQTVNLANAETSNFALTVNNAGEATITGFELEAQAAPMAHWLLDASIGYTNAKFTRWYDDIEGDLTYRKFPHTPEWTLFVG